MDSLLQSKVSIPQFLIFVPDLSSKPVNFHFISLDAVLLSPAPTVGLQFCSIPCRSWCSAVNQLFTFSSQPSSGTGLYFRSPFTTNSSIYIFRIQIIPIYPASGGPNHYIILKYYHWNSCGSHSLSSFVKPTYKISSFTFRCLIYIWLNRNILFGMFFWNGKIKLAFYPELVGNANMVLTMKMLM